LQTISRRAALAAGLGAAVSGCASIQPGSPAIAPRAPGAYGLGALPPLDLSPAHHIKTTVCTRPFRPAGPRLEEDRLGERILIHNYGHGGSGWSLAWGYAQGVAAMAALHRPHSVAVLGAGAIGLTTAILLAESGAAVTIYARELPMESRSARASGVWSPSSRIGFAGAVDPGFAARWEALARASHARHLRYVGRSGNPVEYTPRFHVRAQEREPALAQPPAGAPGFLHLDRRLGGLEPGWREREGTPFAAGASVRGGLAMVFNIAEYTRQLTEDFLAMGGRIERAEIASRDGLAALPGDLVVNCAGYGAKTLAGDETLVPVRGQIAWLAPQTDRLYGFFHRGVMALSRRDGLLIQELGGNDWWGYGSASETASRAEFTAALTKAEGAFAAG